MDWLGAITGKGLSFLSSMFVLAVGLGALLVLALFIADITQRRNAIRRNYPVIGRFRGLFIKLGEFFRQYFFALDREEMPFNRAERDWVYKSSEGEDNTAAFGSTNNLNIPGAVIFVNAPFPTEENEGTPAPPVVIGPGCPAPYEAQSILNISAMSYGAISQPAVCALSRGAKLGGCWLNTGEGGLSPYHLEGGGDLVFQIGTANYGVRNADGTLDFEALREVAAYEQVKMIELKLSQGAKPGKGGLLPGVKVTAEIATIRGIPEGEESISPNGHPGVDNVSELLDHIGRIREAAGKPAGFKTVIGETQWLDEMCEEIRRHGIEHAPDFITIDSGDGGSGAAPMALMDNCGLLIREALPLTVDILARNGLRERIKVIASGKLITPAEVAWAYCAGADFVNSARGFMLALGCIQSMRCNKNTCPTGIATHDARLQAGLDPRSKAIRVKNFVERMRKDVGIIAHSCGVAHPRALKRHHCRIIQANGLSVPMDELHPPQRTRS
ncbi:ferredoxin-dependent glutamate synthase 1 [bacterium BMS3Bbin10]|nr:ferredoxin-dependent glutamate synthase 1 [bacterium BMS3Bbin10]